MYQMESFPENKQYVKSNNKANWKRVITCNKALGESKYNNENGKVRDTSSKLLFWGFFFGLFSIKIVFYPIEKGVICVMICIQLCWHIVDSSFLEYGTWTMFGPFKGLVLSLMKVRKIKILWPGMLNMWYIILLQEGLDIQDENIWRQIWYFYRGYTILSRYLYLTP